MSTVSRLGVSPGGRSSVSGVVATVFGGSGFFGRYVVDRLGRIGSQVIVPFRDDGMEVRHLRVLGDVGQITPVPFYLRDRESIRKAVSRSNVVINLIGRSYETRNFTFNDVHVAGARLIAEEAAEAGVERFVQFSALGASDDSQSPFLVSKFKGEEEVLKVFPNATIMRPAATFGFEDRLLNRYAQWALKLPIVPLINGGNNLIQPVFVENIADGLMSALNRSDALGATYSCGGPEKFALKHLLDIVCKDLELRNNTMTLPAKIASIYGALFEMSPWPPLLTRDEVQQMTRDAIVPADALSLANLDVPLTPIDSKARTILSMYRRNRSYAETETF